MDQYSKNFIPSIVSIQFVVLFLLFTTFNSHAEYNGIGVERINMQRGIYPQEKLHVVTDRDLYCGGDTIWLRTFVVDAASHQQVAFSKYVYVELINPFGELNKRVKIIERDGLYSGYIPVDEDIFEGIYTLAAYTMYSENQGKDYFFRKQLRLLDQHSSKYVIESEFIPTSSGEVKGTFKVKSLNGEKMNYNKMGWTMQDGKMLSMPDSKNGFSRQFKRDKGENVVLVTFGDYGRYIPIEYPVEKTELTFYPEGGWLIANHPCNIAFKATDENGKGVEASGIIRNDKGEETAKFNTVHNGMGSVILVPEPDRTYTAEYIGPDAVVRSAIIGAPKQGGSALRYAANDSKVTFSVAGSQEKDLELVVASRGVGILSAPISPSIPISFDKTGLPEGLYQSLLVSKTDSLVLSERLFFITEDRHKSEITSFNSDSTSIKLHSPNGIWGDCSVRIINGKILPYSDADNIRNQLLLQSELRGRIENPSYYFQAQDKETERNLDLLMMVNGWSRYNIPEAILGHYEEPLIPLEIGQEISGQVRSRWKGKPMEGVLMYAIAPKYNFGTFAETDSNGNFSINGFDFPDGTSFIFRAMNEKGNNESNYDIFNQTFPSVDILKHSTSSFSSIDAADFFSDIRWIMLDEIKVQAFNNSDKDNDIFKALSRRSLKSEDLASRGVTSLEQALRTIPGMIMKDNHLYYRGQLVSFFIDGVKFETAENESSYVPKVISPGNLPGTFARSRFADPSLANANPYNTRMVETGTVPMPNSKNISIPSFTDISMAIPFQDIERIDFLNNNGLIYDQSGGAIIMITTKSGGDKHSGKQFELKDHLPLGYQKYKEYASPILSVDTDEYDLQTHPTLLWLPSVKFDESGKAIDLKHPIKSNYRVVIEGLTDNGDIIFEQY